MSELAKKWVRHSIQAVATLLQNANFKGFLEGKIYQGPTKSVCVPGLNCYSCPGAIGACPVGSLQNYLSGLKFKVPYYVVGILIFVGALLGRAVCGFLCPFGFLQDLLYKIPFFKKNEFKLDKYLRYFKYVVLAVFVLLLPFCFKLTPFFCKYICPAGTLEGGIPHLLMNESLRKTAGALWNWKLGILILVILGSVFVPRFFCRYLCPLGAFYSLFNRFSLYRMDLDKSKCVDCKSCENVCPMAVKVTEHINSPECIRCGKCKAVCPVDAISSRFETDMLTRNVAVKKVD